MKQWSAIEPVLEWLERCCNRENLAPGGIGMAIYDLADEGLITENEAKLLTLTVLSAGADTTVLTMANVLASVRVVSRANIRSCES